MLMDQEVAERAAEAIGRLRTAHIRARMSLALARSTTAQRSAEDTIRTTIKDLEGIIRDLHQARLVLDPMMRQQIEK